MNKKGLITAGIAVAGLGLGGVALFARIKKKQQLKEYEEFHKELAECHKEYMAIFEEEPVEELVIGRIGVTEDAE